MEKTPRQNQGDLSKETQLKKGQIFYASTDWAHITFYGGQNLKSKKAVFNFEKGVFLTVVESDPKNPNAVKLTMLLDPKAEGMDPADIREGWINRSEINQGVWLEDTRKDPNGPLGSERRSEILFDQNLKTRRDNTAAMIRDLTLRAVHQVSEHPSIPEIPKEWKVCFVRILSPTVWNDHSAIRAGAGAEVIVAVSGTAPGGSQRFIIIPSKRYDATKFPDVLKELTKDALEVEIEFQ